MVIVWLSSNPKYFRTGKSTNLPTISIMTSNLPHEKIGFPSVKNLYFTPLTISRQTPASTRSVHLLGSWDNFTKHYPMERDNRRSRGQWRGCYTFEDIICDGDGESSPKRSGGLKMGSTYYYYVRSTSSEAKINELTVT